MNPEEQLEFAKSHLRRVQAAWLEPVDWADLSNYGLYALEAAVMAACQATGIEVRRTHWSKSGASGDLAEAHGLPAVSELMNLLNEARKASNYGDTTAPSLDPGTVAIEIEAYVDAVGELLESLREEGDEAG